MLASLLPGFRDLRTPLAAGVLFLVAAWVVWGDRIPHPDDASGFAARLYSLSDVLGIPVLVGAATFVAYLVGSSWHFTTIAVTRRIGRARIALPERLQESLDSVRTDENLHPQEWKALSELVDEEKQELRSKLMIKNDKIYDGFDRKESEAEFRLTIGLPLALVIGVLATDVSEVFYAAFAIVAVLTMQAVWQAREATQILTEAIATEVIDLPRTRKVLADLNRTT